MSQIVQRPIGYEPTLIAPETFLIRTVRGHRPRPLGRRVDPYAAHTEVTVTSLPVQRPQPAHEVVEIATRSRAVLR